MFESLECPRKSKDYCETLYIKSIDENEKRDVMNILEKDFPEEYPHESDFWEDLIDINPTFVLKMNGDVVGMSSIRYPQLIQNRPISWIDLIAVDPKYQRIGLGEELLKASEDVMKDMGAKKGKLWTNVDRTGTVSFYSKHDWKVKERTEWGYRNGHRLTMEKVIK